MFHKTLENKGKRTKTENKHYESPSYDEGLLPVDAGNVPTQITYVGGRHHYAN